MCACHIVCKLIIDEQEALVIPEAVGWLSFGYDGWIGDTHLSLTSY